MFNRRKSQWRKRRRARRERELVLNVTSPRIVFFRCLKWFRGVSRKALIVLVLVFAVWFGYEQVNRHFNNSDEFGIKYSSVTNYEGEPTVILSRSRVFEIAGIDPTGTIFSVDIDEARARLMARPEVMAAKLKRILPNTIDIQLDERVPVAWLSCLELGLAGRSPHKGILLDSDGVSFACERGFWNAAKDLPVIEISASSFNEFPVGKKMRNADAERALSLVMKLREQGDKLWDIDRVKVENFYTLHVISKDGVIAVCGMHDHDRQLHQLHLAREHATRHEKELAWIDLRPKMNVPVHYRGGGAIMPDSYTPKGVADDGLDPATRSILNQN